MNEPIICTCFEVRFSKAAGRNQRRHGRMTLRGAYGGAGLVRFKCQNRHCGRTVRLRLKYISAETLAAASGLRPRFETQTIVDPLG